MWQIRKVRGDFLPFSSVAFRSASRQILVMQVKRKPGGHWGLADILRLELLAHAHEKARLAGRERIENEANQAILKELLTKDPEARHWERRRFLKSWMESKWMLTHGETAGSELLENLQRSGRFLVWGAFATGLIVHSLWSQLGNSVNVMAVFVTHVILPLVLLLSLSWHLLPGKASGGSGNPARAWHPVVMLFTGLCRRFSGETSAGSSQRVPIADVLKFVLQRRANVLGTWVSMLVQRAAVAYLAGFWIWFVFQLLTRSAAFTWGTTLSSVISADRVSGFVDGINIPWKWFYAGPTPEQVAATQSWYGQALPVAKSGWEAWAVFLMLAILVYAILPRLLLLAFEGIRLRWLISRETFDALRFERLLNGMLIRTGINPDAPDPSERQSEPVPAAHMPGKSRKSRDRDVGLLIGLDSLIEGQENELSECLIQRFQLADARWIRLGESAEGLSQLRERIRERLQDWLPFDHNDRVLHLVDSEQNPKQSYRSRLSVIREIIGPQAGFVFVLTGGSQKSLQEREAIWLKSIRKWGDFNTDVVSLETDGSSA